MEKFKVPLTPSSSPPQNSDLKLAAVFDVAKGIHNLRTIPFLKNEHEIVYVVVMCDLLGPEKKKHKRQSSSKDVKRH